LIDFDHWKKKHRSNTNSKLKSAYFNPKEFRGSGDAQPRSRGKWIIWILLIATGVSAVFVERGWTPETLLRKANIFFEMSDGDLIETAKSIISAKTIIPGVISTAQTGFKDDFKEVVIEFNPNQLIAAGYRYSTSHDFYATTEKMQGSISYRVQSGKPDSKTIKGEVIIHMWGFKSSIFGYNSRRTLQICPETIKQSSRLDDERQCGADLATGIAKIIETENGKTIKLKLRQTKDGEIKGFYVNDKGEDDLVGGFKLRDGDTIKNVMTHTLHFKGEVSDCKEIEPIVFEITSVKNNERQGDSFLHQTGQEFACKDQVKSRVRSGRIVHEIKEKSDQSKPKAG